jgi:hypothetical protein
VRWAAGETGCAQGQVRARNLNAAKWPPLCDILSDLVRVARRAAADGSQSLSNGSSNLLVLDDQRAGIDTEAGAQIRAPLYPDRA